MTLCHSRPVFPLALAGLLALTACSTAQQGPKAVALPPPGAQADEQLPSTGQADPDAQSVPSGAPASANSGGTYPYGSVQPGISGGDGQAAAETGGEIVVRGPDGKVWSRSGAPDVGYRSDVEACYAYAQGQVDHDARIESDVNAAFQSEAGGLGLTALRGRMSNFERSRRQPSLFNSCMIAKGYNRR